MKSALLFSVVLAAVLTGCGSNTPIGKAQSTADQALALAQRAMTAHDDGTASGTTLAGELEEAASAAEDAQGSADSAQVSADAAAQRLDELESRIDDLQSRLDVICINAPNAC